MVDSAVHRPVPTANGTLAKTPLVHLLLYVLDKKLSGTLDLLTPDKRSASVVFVAGQPGKVRTSEPVAYLGRVLLELGFLTEEQLTRSLADLAKQKAAGPRLHGEALLGQGLIDQAKLSKGLHEQIARKLRHAAAMPPETVYGYFEAFDGLARWGGAPESGVDPYSVLWSMVREHPSLEHVQGALQKIGASALRVRGPDVSRLGLTGEELKLVELMRERPLGVADMTKAGQLNERTAQLLAYLLLVTKQVDVLAAEARASRPPIIGQRLSRPPTPLGSIRPSGAAPVARSSSPIEAARVSSPQPIARPSTPMEAGRRSAPPGERVSILPVPPGLSPELTARWKEITERASTIDRADYFSMLDVAKDTTVEEIESAYFALAKVWHPDRLPAELAPIRDACSRVFGRMSEARATLTDAKQRERYLKLVAEGSGSPETQETVARVVEASTHFQKADICFKRNDMAQAEEFCRRAIELDDTQPDYLAMLAWLIALKPESQGGDATMQCIRMLDKAVAMSAHCEKAFFWRGMLYKRLGKAELASRDFKKSAELNPRNIDAVREVRLHTMRGGASGVVQEGKSRDSSPPPPKSAEKPGLLGRLFKKS
jgi:tetratricopeptide (TPR) repeat protein